MHPVRLESSYLLDIHLMYSCLEFPRPVETGNLKVAAAHISTTIITASIITTTAISTPIVVLALIISLVIGLLLVLRRQ